VNSGKDSGASRSQPASLSATRAFLGDQRPGIYAPCLCCRRSRNPKNEADRPRFTPRQKEALPLLARGMANKEIARALNLAEPTVKIHTAALMRALGAKNRTSAVLAAYDGSIKARYLSNRILTCDLPPKVMSYRSECGLLPR
jgi:DNA-binding NarL/FixJ family response regulator